MTKDKSIVFFVVVGLFLASCSFSVFELAQNMAAIAHVSVGEAVSVVVKAFGSSAVFSFVGAIVALILIVINVVNGALSAKHSTSGKVVGGLLRVPTNFVLLVVFFGISFMIYSEYFYTPVVNPLSGSMNVDIISAVSALVLVFVKKF